MNQYGLIGFPLGHSFSKKYFDKKFREEGIGDSCFDLYPIEDISGIREFVQCNSIKGFSVTIPYKEAIIKYLDVVDNTAKAIGAVNSVKAVFDDGKLFLKGYNTDYIGFVEPLKLFVKDTDIKGALILGTGGASKAVDYALKDIGFETTFISRGRCKGVVYADISKEIIDSVSVIVNTTPLGTFPDTESCPDIPYHMLTQDHLVYDLVYNPAETLFIKNAKAYGARFINGQRMLEVQADASWRIWND
ncbi:MAG: shikimate dehydrogenase [Bacteroidales bacterium]|jgi:shikimate dehydrogenase|nr:shikimate dehydrogenase [Bacteroidales bacterium]